MRMSLQDAAIPVMLAAGLAFLPVVAHATTFNFSPDESVGKDAEIDSIFPANNNGLDFDLILNWSGNARSIGLIEFDVSSIPFGSTVSVGKFSLFHSDNSCNGCRYDVFRVTSSWNESTVTFNTAPTIDPVAVASLIFPDNSTFNYLSWDVTSLVNGWVNGLFPNFGMWIEEIPVQGTANAYFRSSNNIASQRPILAGTFAAPVVASVPEPSTFALFGFGLLGLGAMLRRRKAKA